MIKKIFRLLFKTLFWFLVVSIFFVLAYKWLPVPVTPLMVIRNIEQKQDGQKVVWKHEWVPIESISEDLQLAVICSEDQKFLSHHGFDLEAIEDAIETNKEGKRLKGGSTISQQTAKNVFLWPKRSWVRKGFEVYFTFLIELFWSKERILEVYLNSIEMGNGVYGAEAASWYWFNKSAGTLTKYEAAALAAILPNPKKYKASPATTYIQSRKEWILRQMRNYGPFDLKKKIPIGEK
ncbi:monofunctional biosynthetic peptidoglycan transglycosylase [Zhouia amylolytica]|uniref:Biosynthetic peptidoglycan transglycosylase n=1 Tax=Zhouia amylolytica TaxID=376730 RepID=A0A1I6S760_9FLAO|nr:monofunctional biosynthetic peptidoglycan transglycosylase [Zhouia amylolytica]MCQ0110984.1 monofunctional biosynthetic peptidoglycan transglycosylase [Zhouia amylolytica]SFS72829.1 monofunctional biosynthetic peptidoglycan transglycosylase [Zhouia amylolytica]